MINVFLYGTLRHPALLELVAGKSWRALAPEAARLEGHRVVWADGHSFPLIEVAAGQSCDGLILRDVEGEVLERLNHYELGFGYDLREVSVRSDAGVETAHVYFPQPGLWQAGAPWSLADWVRDFWPLTRYSAREVMGYIGVLSGAQIADRYKMILTRAAASLLAENERTPTEYRCEKGREDVDLLAQEVSHAGYFLLKTLQLRHMRFDGEMSGEMEREVFVAGDAATVLPYDPLRDRVMVIEQIRMGAYVRGDRHPWLLEPIAGRIDGFETPESTAHRETEEEAGLQLHRLEPIARYYASPGYSTEMFHSFVGITDLPDAAAGLGGVADEQEDIRSHVLSFDAAMRLIETGEANDAPLVVSLLWLAKERERLRAMAKA